MCKCVSKNARFEKNIFFIFLLLCLVKEKKNKKIKVLKSAHFTYTLTQIPLQNGVENKLTHFETLPTPLSRREMGGVTG